MSYTMEDFERDYAREHLYLLSPKDVVECFSIKEVVECFSIKEVVEYLSPEVVLKQFPPEVIEEYLTKLKKS